MTVVLNSDNAPTDELSVVELEASDIGVTCAAIAVRVSGLWNRDAATLQQWALLRCLEADGSMVGQARIDLTATTGEDGAHYYAPLLHALLHDANIGLPRDLTITVQAETHSRALALADQYLREGMLQCKIRTFTTTAIPDVIPVFGQTVHISTYNFTGVMCATPGLEMSEGQPMTLTLKLLDLANPFYG